MSPLGDGSPLGMVWGSGCQDGRMKAPRGLFWAEVESVFVFFFFRRRKTEVSEREIDSRRRHSACETVIAMHLVK